MFRKFLQSANSAQHQYWLCHKLQRRSGILFVNQLCKYSSSSDAVAVSLNSETGIAVVKWKNLPVNSLGYEFIQKSTETLQTLEKYPNCKAVIVTSAIPNIFCAGLDFKEIRKPSKERFAQYINATNTLWATIYGLKIPTIAAINGMSIRNWITQAFINVVGHHQAEFGIMRGQLFTPHEALAIGLVDELASNDEELIEKAKLHAAMLASLPSTARHQSKLAFRQPLLDDLQDKSSREGQRKRYADPSLHQRCSHIWKNI